MADDLTRHWQPEQIPNADRLYMRVHRALYTEGRYAYDDIPPGAFANHPRSDPAAGMSTDWNRYATAEDTQSDRNRRDSTNYAVIELGVGDARRIPGQSVVQTPITEPGLENRAHTDAFGDKRSNPDVRIMFRRIARVANALE